MLDLGVNCRLDLAAWEEFVGIHSERQQVAGLDRCRRNLTACVCKIDAQRTRALLGQLDELRFQDDAVDGHVDERDLVLDPSNPLG